MSTPFKSEWLQPGAVIPVDIPTLAAFAEELRRVNQENQALRQALEPEQEPVAWISEGGDVSRSKRYMDEMGFKCNPLYTSPPKKEWVSLTGEEVSEIIDREIGFNSCWGPEETFARAIEAKLREKNHG